MKPVFLRVNSCFKFFQICLHNYISQNRTYFYCYTIFGKVKILCFQKITSLQLFEFCLTFITFENIINNEKGEKYGANQDTIESS